MSFLTGWKVLNNPIIYGYTSCFARWKESITVYHDDKWTQRQSGNGPLTVFDTYQNAIIFTQGVHTWSVCQCLYIPSIDQALWFTPYGLGERMINQGLGYLITGHVTKTTTESHIVFDYPKGTCFADAVYLTGDNNEIHSRAYVWS